MEIYGLSFIYEWLEKNSYILLYLGIFSFCIFFMSIFGIKYFAAKIPQDYFTNKQRVSKLKESSIVLWLFYIDYKKLNWLHIYNSWDPGISSPWSGHSNDFDRIGYERLSWQAKFREKNHFN